MTQAHRMAASRPKQLRRPCIPCRISKKGCSRETPFCQSCCDRGLPNLCFYEERVPLCVGYDTIPPIQPESSVQQNMYLQDEQAQIKERSHKTSDVQKETHKTIQAAYQPRQEFESPSANAASLHRPFKTSSDQIEYCANIGEPVTLQRSPGFASGGFVDTADSEERASSPSICWKQPYFQMTLPVCLPPPLQIRIPAPSALSAENSHTMHQLLLVLNYLFITSMLPGDEGALWAIIYRTSQDWERSFVLQYSQLQSWLTDIRAALTKSQGLHTMSCEDLEMQIRYILFLLGQHASHDSSFYQACFGQARFPYRPFGVGASIALICYAFMGIEAVHIPGYESKEIWLRDGIFFSCMLERLRMSPIFSSGLSMGQLQSILLGLQRVFQEEEVRVASVKPQRINVNDSTEMRNYFTQAFLSLSPLLLPKISLVALGIEPPATCTIHQLAALCADVFYDSHPIQILEKDFRRVSEILRSKPDRVVVIEMFHVKAWQERLLVQSSEEMLINIFHVSIEPMARFLA